jgi:hypothetical protein
MAHNFAKLEDEKTNLSQCMLIVYADINHIRFVWISVPRQPPVSVCKHCGLLGNLKQLLTFFTLLAFVDGYFTTRASLPTVFASNGYARPVFRKGCVKGRGGAD